MRKVVFYIVILVIAQVLFFNIAITMAMDMDEQEAAVAELFMARHISAVCDIKISPRDVVYVGENNGNTWFYTNAYYDDETHKCAVVTRDSQVWSFPTSEINK